MAATTVRGLALINTLIVAGSTLRDPVRPPQWEAGQVMIEFGLLPEVLRMTILAGQELTMMRLVLVMTLAAFLT